MGWTSTNFINPQYSRKQTLFIGTQTGCVKKLETIQDNNAFVCENLHNLANLTKESRLTAMTFSDINEKYVLVGRLNGEVELCATCGTISENTDKWKFKGPANIVNLLSYKDFIIAAMSNGQLQCLTKNHSQEEEKTLTTVGTSLSRLRQCPTNLNIVATGGKERQNNLKVLDLSMDGYQLFTSKNLPNDSLQLEIPVWDCDIGFLHNSEHTLTTCSRYGYVRVYDTRKQRRPILNYTSNKKIAFNNLAAYDHNIYTGCTTGEIRAFDARQMKNFVHTYKGAVGSISDLCLTADGKYMLSTSLDRYVRIHDTDNCQLLYQCYVKAKATHVLMMKEVIKEASGEQNNSAVSGQQKKESISPSQKNDDILPQMRVDDEYEEIFSNMPKVYENDENHQETIEKTFQESKRKIKRKAINGEKQQKSKRKPQ